MVIGKLQGFDYINRPLLELQSHPDFSIHAYLTVAAIGNMSTQELEELGIQLITKEETSNGT